VTGQGILIVFS